MNSDLKQTHDEVLRRLGRNLLLFQQIEFMLKTLLIGHKCGGTTLDFQERLQKRKDSINKTMLGNLVDKYVTDFLQDAGAEVPQSENPADWYTFTLRIEVDTEFAETIRRDMKLITDHRNELVHGFLPRWHPDSPDRLEEALIYLDAQREKITPIHEHLRGMLNHTDAVRKKCLEYVNSDEFLKQLELLWLQASPLVMYLREVSARIHRTDGWTYLAHAGTLANKELPEEVNNLRERYGFPTLKKLLVGSEMFDLFDEPLNGGGFRALYKNKACNDA